MRFRLSKYNIGFDSINGEKVIFNIHKRVPVVLNKENEWLISELDSKSEFIEDISDNVEQSLLAAGIICPCDYDEEKEIDIERHKKIEADDILEFTILPTDACNCDCIYCYQHEPYHHMSIEDADKFLLMLKKNIKSYKKLVINWFGGEPLLEKKIIEYIMSRVDTICKESKVSYVGRMTTNGCLLDVDTFNTFLRCHILYYQITIDGTKEIHNKQRPLKNAGDAYGTIINNLKQIKENVKSKAFEIMIRTNVSNEIMKNMKDIIDQYEEIFGNDKRFYWSWEPVQDWGGEKIEENRSVVINEYDEYFRLMDYALTKDINFSVELLGNGEEWVCLACKKHGFVLNHNDQVHKCTMALYDEEEHVREMNDIGYIDEDGNIKLDSEKANQWSADNRKITCKDCKYYPLCKGIQCPYAVTFKNVQECHAGKIVFLKRLIEKQVEMEIKNGEGIVL